MTKTIEQYSLEQMMSLIEKALNEKNEAIQDVNSVYQFDIKDEDVVIYQLQLSNGVAKVTKGSELEAVCTLKMSLGSFRKFLIGKLNGTTAFMMGKLKIDGDLGKAMKIESILRQYDIEEYL
ncbi:hypothetical protein GCM10008967_36350 [Bacillus carboniphilus]|uniref:SCP2 domain-containing protein n=1 Tax=Bacillus carboniphilus TaxID=86663 RepID=A0ABN0WNT9_9BACI